MRLISSVTLCVLLAYAIRSSDCSKVSEFLKKKFENYDGSVRPDFGGKPVQVTVSGYVLDMSDIDEVKQEFTVSLYLRHEWKDSRLEFTEAEAGAEKLILDGEYSRKIWTVDTFVVNERDSQGHDLINENRFCRVSSDGTILMSIRHTIRASCRLDLGWFPFDRHTCPLLLESYGFNTNDVDYEWKADEFGNIKGAVGVSSETTSIKFGIAAVNARKETVQLKQKGYSRLAVEFFFIRASTRYIQEFYFPAVLLTFLSFITLLHATGTPRTRLQLSVLVEGLMMILMSLYGRFIPPVSYQTALDFYLVFCLIIISLVVAVNVVICLLVSNANETNGVVRLRSVNDEGTNAEDDGKEVLFDTGPKFLTRTSRLVTISIKLRFLLPLIFAVFNLLYWMIVLIGSSFFPTDYLVLENYEN